MIEELNSGGYQLTPQSTDKELFDALLRFAMVMKAFYHVLWLLI